MNRKSKLLKGSAAVLATIVLGAIGSGVWDVLLKRVFASGRDTLLNIVSFGMKSVKDSTYQQIAQGFRESASTDSLTWIIFLLVRSVVLLYIRAFLNIRKVQSKLASARSNQTADDKSGKLHHDKKTLDKFGTQIVRLRRIFYIGTIVAVFWSSFILADLARFRYVNAAIAHFQQTYAIVAPFMDEHERMQVISTFAQIKNREDYLKVLEHLNSVAHQNGQTPPEFKAW